MEKKSLTILKKMGESKHEDLSLQEPQKILTKVLG